MADIKKVMAPTNLVGDADVTLLITSHSRTTEFRIQRLKPEQRTNFNPQPR